LNTAKVEEEQHLNEFIAIPMNGNDWMTGLNDGGKLGPSSHNQRQAHNEHIRTVNAVKQ